MLLKFKGKEAPVINNPICSGVNVEPVKESKTRRGEPQYFKAVGTLIELAEHMNFNLKFCKFEMNNGMIKGNRIGIREGMTEKETAYTIAHEIAHAYLHYDKGDTVNSPLHNEYEEQADRAAKMLLKAVMYLS